MISDNLIFDPIQLQDYLLTGTNKCYEIRPNENLYQVILHDYIPAVSRVHVKFSDATFGTKAHCKSKTFFNQIQNKKLIPLPHINGFVLFTPDPNIKRKCIYHECIYLVKEEFVTDLINNTSSSETNICPCVIESSGLGHGGTIILGTEEKLNKIIFEQQIYFKKNELQLKKLCDDTCEILVAIKLSHLEQLISDKKGYEVNGIDHPHLQDNQIIELNEVLKMVVKTLLLDEDIVKQKDTLSLLTGFNFYQADNTDLQEVFLDVSHGKRRWTETPKECAIRELREEFAIEIKEEDLGKEYYTCLTHFFLKKS